MRDKLKKLLSEPRILYFCKVGGFNDGTVTHWMPLPMPPTEKGGADE